MGGLNTWITKNGVVYDFYTLQKNSLTQIYENPLRKEQERKDYRKSGHVVMINHINANTQPFPRSKYIQEGYYNYFTENNPEKWATYVGLYKETVVENIYEGIHQRWYSDNNRLRYDYIISPHADYKQIQIQIDGAYQYEIKNNNLVFTTRFGEVQQTELVVYQMIEGRKVIIPAQWQKQGKTFNFILDNYNPAYPVIIDPLVWSTFLGGNNMFDWGDSVKADASSNVYVTGYSDAAVFPVTANDETVPGIAIDGTGNVYVTGRTDSNNYPVTAGAFDVTYNGNADVFVTKLNNTGNALVYSTFIGGTGDEYCNAICVNSAREVYIAGFTNSSGYPTVAGSFDISYNGAGDAFVTKLNTTGTALVYSIFLGGAGQDDAFYMDIDAANNAYITGRTPSAAFPTTAGAFDVTHNGGDDVFVTKLNAAGNALVYSTFIGSANTEFGHCIAVDNMDNACITGETWSGTFPTTAGCFDNTLANLADGFVLKLNSTGNTILYSTFIGGNGGGNERGTSIDVDNSEYAYITGFTISNDFPTTAGAFDVTYNGGFMDAYVSKLCLNGTTACTTPLPNYNISLLAQYNAENHTVKLHWKSDISDGLTCKIQKNIHSTIWTTFYEQDFNIKTCTDKDISPRQSIQYRIIATDKDGHNYYSNIETITIPEQDKTFILYPNPVQYSFVIENFTSTAQEYEIIDITGKILQTYTLPQGKNSIEISLSKGMYFVRERKQGYTQKLIVE